MLLEDAIGDPAQAFKTYLYGSIIEAGLEPSVIGEVKAAKGDQGPESLIVRKGAELGR